MVGGISDGKDVRREFPEPVILVELNILGVVDGVILEWVDRDEDRPNICVDVSPLESGL